MNKKSLLFLAALVIWCLINWPPDWQHVSVGIAVAAFVTFITRDLFHSNQPLSQVLRKSAAFIFSYVPVCLWEMLKANVDVAYRILHPRLLINPGIIKVPVSLQSDMALAFLSNSLTLASGAMCVDLDRENRVFYVHCIDVGGENITKTAARFEKLLIPIFEEEKS